MSDAAARLNATLEGRYRIERVLGEGGMATVYLADDVRHERKVALKVLKPELAAVVGAERFLAEIKTTANLQHPHILPLFDSGEADGFLFYVMPYVEGESLRGRLDREHQLPVDEAVQLAKDVAEALEAAHEQGVIHRDIKPANILLSRGRPLIADFGIALAVSAAVGGRLTETGVTLGTPHYMSPEQASGDVTVGAATDIYAVGCVLYEMLVGEPPFTGRTPQAVLGKIIAAERPDASAERRSVPAHVDAAIRKALEKLPADRFTTAVRLAAALSDRGFRHGDTGHVPEATVGQWRHWSIALAALLAVTLVWTAANGLQRRSEGDESAQSQIVRFKLSGSYPFGGRVVAISPQGTHVAHASLRTPLEVRAVSHSDTAIEVAPLPALQPFFSPSGEWIGFFSGFGNVLRVRVTGGEPLRITSVGDARSSGGTWVDEGTIVFATTAGLYRASVDGGAPEFLAAPDSAAGEQYYSSPTSLPGGAAVLFTILPQGAISDAQAIVAALDLESLEKKVVLRGGGGARYATTGHLIYSAGARLHAVAFDSEALEVRGVPTPLLIDDLAVSFASAGDFDLSRDGTLVYRPAEEGARVTRRLAWVARDGSEEPLSTPPGPYLYPRISPDGTRIALDVSGTSRNIHVWDVRRESLTRVTDDPAEEIVAEWSLDDRLLFSSNRSGPFQIYARSADGVGAAEPVTATTSSVFVMGPTPDGDRLLAVERRPGSEDLDLVSISLDQTSGSETLLSTEYNESVMHASPDGRAYQSDATGRMEVYVGPASDLASRRWQVSVEGGAQPMWSPPGDELFYMAPSGALMNARVEPAADFAVGEVSELLPDGPISSPLLVGRSYDISPLDGRFLMLRSVGQTEEGAGIIVITNWLSDVQARLPSG